MVDFEYEGQIYVRPLGRGVSLVELGSKDLAVAIEDAVGDRFSAGSGWTGTARISVEIGEAVTGEQDD